MGSIHYSRFVLLLFVLVFSGVLAASFFIEHVFNVTPCAMCKWERYIYVAAFTLLTIGYASPIRFSLNFLWGLLALLLLEGGVTLYHVGLEHHFFELPSFCGGKQPHFEDVEALKTYLAQQKTIVRCDVPPFRFLQRSLAEWNFLLSVGLGGTVVYAIQKLKKAF